MKAKVRDLLEMWDVMKELSSEKQTPEFSYFLTKNKLAIQKIIAPVEYLREIPEKIVEYERKRVLLAQTYADKDNEGKPKVDGKNYVIVENSGKFHEEIQKLKDEYKDVFEERKSQVEEIEKIMETEQEFKETKIQLDHVPNPIKPSYLEPFLKLDLIVN